MIAEEFTLQEICLLITDGAHNSPKSVSVGLPMASVKDLSSFGINLQTCRLISENDFNRLVKMNCQPIKGDVLIAKDGASALDTVCEIRNNIDVVLLSSVAILRPNPDFITPTFLRYYLDNPRTRRYIKGAFITGAAIPRVVLEDFKRVKVTIPPLPIQRKISSILSAYDDLIENNTRRIQILEDIAQAIYREWFVHFRFPGHEDVKMVESELGMIPEGWEVIKLSELVSTQYGYTESANAEEVGPKYVRGMDINKTSYINWGQVPYCAIDDYMYLKYKLFPGDILIIRMADPGKVGIVERNIEAVFASYLIRLIIKNEKVKPNFLYHLLMSDYYQDYISGASTGTTRKSASAGVITDINLILPPKNIGDNFDIQITDLRKLLNILLDKNENLRCTRDLLLPRLISGELDVSELDIHIKEDLL